MLKKSLFVSLVLLVLVTGLVFGQQKVYRVNNLGQITIDGTPTRMKGGSWFGLEGRHEPSNDANNPSGAPMEQYMGNVFWSESGRTYDQDINEFKQMGINLVRLPLVPQTLDANDPQGKAPFLKNASSVRIDNARLALETIVKKLNTAGIYVLLDIHSCSNYIGWRKGRLDARPPWADKNREDYDFKRENCSCASTGNPSGVTKTFPYDETKWVANLKTVAGFATSLSVSNILGIDIYNEPWDYSWADWKSLIEKAYAAVNSVNTNTLIFAQGISGSNGNQDGTPDTKTDTPHGDKGNPNWGENFFEAGANPPNIPKERLVYSPHTYGPSVCTQPMFADPSQPECATLQEDAFGDAKCKIVINPARLEPSWEEHFGYLKDLGYAICIGEFGGNKAWPGKADKRMRARYSYITDQTLDWQWQKAFKDWLIKRGITDTIYWSINPESADTGGLYTTPYDAVSNTGGWGTWSAVDSEKIALLKEIWNAPTKTPGSPSPTPTPTITGSNVKLGDADGNGSITINDALLVARYSAGLSTPTIVIGNCDVTKDNIVNINDALQIARFTAGFTVPGLSN